MRESADFAGILLVCAGGFGPPFHAHAVPVAASDPAPSPRPPSHCWHPSPFHPPQTKDAHRQRTVNWCDSTGGTAAAFDFTTKGILQARGEGAGGDRFGVGRGADGGRAVQPGGVTNAAQVLQGARGSEGLFDQETSGQTAPPAPNRAPLPTWTRPLPQEALGRGELWRLVDAQGRPPGLLGMWSSRAITFIDNHVGGRVKRGAGGGEGPAGCAGKGRGAAGRLRPGQQHRSRPGPGGGRRRARLTTRPAPSNCTPSPAPPFAAAAASGHRLHAQPLALPQPPPAGAGGGGSARGQAPETKPLQGRAAGPHTLASPRPPGPGPNPRRPVRSGPAVCRAHSCAPAPGRRRCLPPRGLRLPPDPSPPPRALPPNRPTQHAHPNTPTPRPIPPTLPPTPPPRRAMPTS